jgi:hypothetical protein
VPSIEYLVRSKNRLVVKYSCPDGAGSSAWLDIFVGPTAFNHGYTGDGGLTSGCAAISRILWGITNTWDYATIYPRMEVGFGIGGPSLTGKAAYLASGSMGELNFERTTIPDTNKTNTLWITNQLTEDDGGASVVLVELVTRQVS